MITVMEKDETLSKQMNESVDIKHLLAKQTASYQSNDLWTMLSDLWISNISFDKLVQARHNL